ncbi:hypothetical protein [Adhaeribacter soli]|uniref:Uncharacterized protein n=1 Tax=Adhaeribacter soli TaxID=2607655 RepID=A0A5N1J6T1_9BACT|nr:hypothetical protein [Adhaeribacter soli]KAA9345833.1 hypothetical protein F0P94_01755 [Adhaeribacter soli]
MKIPAVILLTIAILLQPLSKMFIVMDYQVNKNYIAQVLCENRSKPKSGCNGKCHLAKELKKADQTEEKHPIPLKDKLEVLHFCQPTSAFAFTILIFPEKEYPHYFSSGVSPPVFGIFHPPRFLV